MNVLYIEGRCYTFGGVLDLGIIQQERWGGEGFK
jgi:hypothetical protein